MDQLIAENNTRSLGLLFFYGPEMVTAITPMLICTANVLIEQLTNVLTNDGERSMVSGALWHSVVHEDML